MIEASTLDQQARVVRQETISILENLTKKAGEFELPKPPGALEHYRQRLVENTYKVLVVGEAKRGKSSFINALIGRDILPTNVRVTTSQVFDVRPAGREAYRLRFEDDSRREITLDDLPRYGSQVSEDAGERPRLDQIIRWIEVDTPGIRFLPDGVSLLDTPGLGALYAAHAQITQRFVPKAEAVIFVLDSEKPIVQSEIEFIETILGETSDIFFIQTKIDLYDEESWQDIQRRNQEILEENFKDRLTDTRVWPISSTLLLAAAAGGEDAEEDLEDSRHKELETALKAFLFRVAGWSRSAEAVLVAEHYQTTSRQTLSGRLAGLVEESEQKRAEMQRIAAQHKQQFQIDWGKDGQKRKELTEDIRRVVSAGKGSFTRALEQGGPIDEAQREKIDGLSSLEEARKLDEAIPGEVKAAAVGQWQRTYQEVKARYTELLGTLVDAADTVKLPDPATLPQEVDLPESAVRNRVSLDLRKLWWKKIKGGHSDAAAATGIIGTVGTVAFIATNAYWIVPAFAVGALAAGAWGLAVGSGEVKAKELETAKSKLYQELDNVLHRIRWFFLGVDLPSGRYAATVDEHFNSLERAALDQVQAVVTQKLEEVEAEHTRLEQAGELDEQQRKDSVERTKWQLAEWDEIGKAIENVSVQLNALDQPSAVTSPAAG